MSIRCKVVKTLFIEKSSLSQPVDCVPEGALGVIVSYYHVTNLLKRLHETRNQNHYIGIDSFGGLTEY